MKRILCLLIAVMMLPAVAACSSGGNEGPKETGAGNAAVPTETEPETTADPYAPFEGLDYEGYAFKYIYNSATNNAWDPYIAVEEATGEVLNDAAFDRNVKLGELLNITFEMTRDSKYETLFKNSIVAGDEAYDMALFWTNVNAATYMTEHLTYNWQDLPYVDLSAEWYNQSANSAFSVAGTQFFGVSDMASPVEQHFRFLYNKQLATDNGLKLRYDDVLAGTWTFDKMLADVKVCYKDLNGNGEADEADCFGFATNPAYTISFFRNTAGPIVTINKEGFIINIYSERIVKLVEKVVGLVEEKGCFYTTTGNNHYVTFQEGRALYCPYGSDPALLRDYEVEFGYLPYPKMTEDEEVYQAMQTGGVLAFPVNLSDPERTGAIMEATSLASHEYIIDAFINTYIEGKVLRDKESVEIYRMMRKMAMYDVSYNLDPSGKLITYSTYYKHFLDTKSTDVASWYASEGPGIVEKYNELWKQVAGK